ncbi:uroporphyrinogen decarboxylase family protein [Haloimpatiens sp. FM7315]|uniref:uroporphyrinogen decarboxylase family protein n=1 Tax=Haloimpatiens sp. FM7315 TaxID=3298609 RepID=UPI0035A290D9
MINYENILRKERIKNFYEGNDVDRVPFYTNATIYSGVLGKLSSKEFYLNPELSYSTQRLVLDIHHCDGSPSFDFPGYTGLMFGGEIEYKDNPYVSIPLIKPRVKSISDIEKIKVPNLEIDIEENLKFKFFKILNEKGVSIPISMGSPLEIVSNICDITLLVKLFRKDTEALHRLLRCATDYLKLMGNITINMFGIDKCYCSSNFPIESLISTKLFENHSLPYFLEVYEYFRSKGVKSYSLHLCGNHNRNLEIFRHIGLPDRTFISLDEKIDMDKASSIFGEKYILAGNVSSNSLLNGTYKEVYSISKDIIIKNKSRKGGFALMPSCTLPPYTPPLNLYAMYKACEDFGKY